MDLKVSNLGKKYEGNWIFRNINLSVSSGSKILIRGRNGSGKSTFAKAVSGLILPSEGSVSYSVQGKEIPEEQAYQKIQLIGPYIDLIEDFTLREVLDFHAGFKPFADGMSIADIIAAGNFNGQEEKYLRHFSSGMKQRVKLLLALFTSCPLLILDEPTSNLDEWGVEWYLRLVSDNAKNKTILVCSNSPQQEASFCTESISMEV
ncbi:MAG: ATP-binding cassette domain-containing protein [Bacteroidetes bacterium]|nr:ATP-binding cassette domain-containing protein [Bacteroidota bacterium]